MSRALRDLPNVAPSTREKIRAVADELDYVGNPSARRLAAGRTGTVAVVVPLFDAWYFSHVVAGLEAVLKDRSVDLLLYAVGSDAERRAFLSGRGVWWQRSDALVMVDIALDEAEARRLDRSGARIVTVGCATEAYSSVTLDERSAAATAARHFVDRRHRRIGVITGDPLSDLFRVPMLRFEGFELALAGAGQPLDRELAVPGNFSIEGGREAMGQLLDHPDPPTAVFAMSDEMAFGALAELRDRGRSVPGDVAVIGFDDHPIAALWGLTTVRQPVEEVGALAGRLVLDAMADGSTPQHHVLETVLIERSTS